jgi:hypothetical protein
MESGKRFFFHVMDMSGNYFLVAGLLQTLNQESMISIKSPKCTWARIILLSGFIRIKGFVVGSLTWIS